MSIEAVKIPQNVYVEDRIIGPVTLRQIIICLLTGGFSYALFSSFQATGALSPVTGVLSWMPLAIGSAFAFVKINGISLTRMCLLIAERLEKPPVRLWTPHKGIFVNISTKTFSDEEEEKDKKKKRTAAATAASNSKHDRIERLSALLDRGPEEVDVATPAGEALTSDDHDPLDMPIDGRSASAPLPVNRNRIQANAGTAIAPSSVDGLTAQASPQQSTPAKARLLRDITPPALQ